MMQARVAFISAMRARRCAAGGLAVIVPAGQYQPPAGRAVTVLFTEAYSRILGPSLKTKT